MRKYFIFIQLFISFQLSAQWQMANGPYIASNFISMDIDKIVVSGSNLCAIINDKIYVSQDQGYSWIYASEGIAPLFPVSIVFKDSMIIAGTSGSGVFISTNYGSSYKAMNTNLPNGSRIEALSLSNNILLAAVRSSLTSTYNVYYSTNLGMSWSPTNGLANKTVNCIVADGSNIYAGAVDGVYRSIDNGLNWIPLGLTQIGSIAVDNNRVFAGQDITSGTIYYSADYGSTWSVAANGITYPSVSELAIGPNFVYAATYWNGIYRSDNNGLNWYSINGGLSNCNSVNTIAVNNSNLYAGCSNGFAISTNEGSSWNTLLKRYALEINDICANSNYLVASTSYTLCTSNNSGLNWNEYLISTNSVASTDTLLYFGNNNGFAYSSNNGNTWYNGGYYLPSPPKIKKIIAQDSIVFSGTDGNGIYHSDDYGLTFGPRNNGLLDLKINTLIRVGIILYAGTNSNGVFYSQDEGLNWYPSSTGITDTCILALSGFNNYVFAGTRNNGMFKSSNFGFTWTPITNGLSPSDTSILCLYTLQNNVFAGISGGGFYFSSDNGDNWVPFNSGLINHNITSITKHGADFFIGTKGGGVWKRSESEFFPSVTVQEIPMKENIKIYPNPGFYLVTILLPGSESYDIEILDCNGQVISVFTNIYHQKIINLEPLKEGLYLIKATDRNGFTYNSKLIRFK